MTTEDNKFVRNSNGPSIIISLGNHEVNFLTHDEANELIYEIMAELAAQGDKSADLIMRELYDR